VLTTGNTGQFDVIADKKAIAQRGGNWFTRSFGAGYPDFEDVVDSLEKHQAGDATLR
jgi:hypothetical protein